MDSSSSVILEALVPEDAQSDGLEPGEGYLRDLEHVAESMEIACEFSQLAEPYRTRAPRNDELKGLVWRSLELAIAGVSNPSRLRRVSAAAAELLEHRNVPAACVFTNELRRQAVRIEDEVVVRAAMAALS